jgi:general secretion pathway protein N
MWLGWTAALGLLVLALLWWFPARWLQAPVQARLAGWQLQQVEGSIWQGRAGELLDPQGQPLGSLQWQLSRRALLGDLRLSIQIAGPRLQLHGNMRRLSSTELTLDRIELNMDARLLQSWQLSPVPIEGRLQLQIDHAQLRGGWPLALDAQGQWRQASLRNGAETVALGDLAFTAEVVNGVLQARTHDLGDGPLGLVGNAAMSPLGWRAQARLQARDGDPALTRWLRQLGPLDARGMVQLQRQGGLAALVPLSSSSTDTP